MTERTSLYSKLSIETLKFMAGGYFAVQLLQMGGVIPVSTAPIPVAFTERAEEQMLTVLAEVAENGRKIDDLHAGLAPRDADMTPAHVALRQSLDRLREEVAQLRHALARSTSATRSLAFELEDAEHRAPLRYDAGTTEGDLPTHDQIHRQSVLDRIRSWWSEVSAG